MPPSERSARRQPAWKPRFVATSYYDAASRLVAQANFGTTSISAPAPTDSVSDAFGFGAGLEPDLQRRRRGRNHHRPARIVAKTIYDLLGRTTETIAAFTDGIPTNDTNQTTAYTYDGDGNVLTMTAVPAHPVRTAKPRNMSMA